MKELLAGKIAFANGEWARMEPLAVLDAGRWTTLQNRVREFPDEGLVFVPPAIGLGHAKYGSFWIFHREPNTRATSAKDRYIVSEAASATPVVDLSESTLEEARVKLFEQGIEVPKNCGDRAVVALAKGLFCTLEFEPASNGVRKACQLSGPLPLMALPPGWLTGGSVEGRSLLPIMAIPQLSAVRRVNWCGDAEFVERVLLRARKHYAQFGSRDGLPGKETLQRIARAIEQQELLPHGEDDFELDFERLRTQWPRLVARFQALEDMGTFVLESDVAIELIEEARHEAAEKEAERVRPIVESQVREALKAELESANGELVRILTKVGEVNASLENARQELARLEQLQAEATIRASTAEQKLTEVAASLERQFHGMSPKEVPFARAVIARLGAALGGKAVPRLPESAAPWLAPLDEDAGVTLTRQALSEALRVQAERNGLASLVELDAFARAGELVLITGGCSERALGAYVDAVASGRLWSMACDPSVIGLDDLWATPPDRSPTGFAMAWSFADAHPDATVVVCLRAIDASPMHLWLPPLAAVLRTRRRPRNLLVLATQLGAPRDAASQDYPEYMQLLKWIVPVQPAPVEGGAIRALSQLSSGLEPKSALRWEDDPPPALALSPELTVKFSNLDGDAALRCARLAMSTKDHARGDGLVAEWATLLQSAEADRRYPWLGIDELRALRRQD